MSTVKKFSSLRVPIIFSFLLWMFAFRGFLFGHTGLSDDAMAYYEHFKFYFDQISRGVFPLWDPTREATGAPIEFFLKRIDPYNPLIYVMLLLYKIGLPFIFAYVLFFALYYFLGMIGFYLLAKEIFRDQRMAFTAYLLLMFSALGTRMFDSYILLTVIPIVWFFYFLLAFFRAFEKFPFLGLTFTAMVLVTTYIPFYFVTILGTFLIVFMFFYFRDLPRILKLLKNFLLSNKLFVMLCMAAFILSLIPGIIFFNDAGKGDFTLPNRHYHSQLDNAMAVDLATISQWGIEEDLRYASVFTDLHKFKFAVMYVPVFAFVMLLLGLGSRLNKRLFLLFAWGIWIFVMFTHRASIYPNLYEHIFYFKYFRNLHFFLWMILLPVFILFLVESMRFWYVESNVLQRKKNTLLIVVVLVHLSLILFVARQGDAIVSTYIALMFSLIFFIFSLWNTRGASHPVALILLLVAVVIQPIQAYHYLDKNTKSFKWPVYRYDMPYLFMEFYDESIGNRFQSSKLRELETFVEKKDPVTYMGSKWMDFLRENLNDRVLSQYLERKLIVYDRWEQLNDRDIDLEVLGRVWADNKNLVFLTEPLDPADTLMTKNIATEAEIITRKTKEFSLLGFDTNWIKFKTNFSQPKIFVYNDCFHSDWDARVNGQKTKIYRANVAFKGIWLPAGENVVSFHFGAAWRYVLHYSLIVVFFAIFLTLIRLGRRFYRSAISHPL